MNPDKVYEGRSTIRMFNMDCMDFLNECEENQYELAIVDPPYGMGIDKDFGKSGGELKGQKTGFGIAARTEFHYSDWDKEKPNKEYWELLNNKSKNQIVWGANHFGSMPSSSCWVVWDKETNGYFADCELAYTSFDTAVRKFKWRWNGMLQENMKRKEKRIHPTQKPKALYRWLLQNYATEGDTILDTHGGSMSIAIACWEEGFDLDIIELDGDYFNDAVKRFENHISQTQLF